MKTKDYKKKNTKRAYLLFTKSSLIFSLIDECFMDSRHGSTVKWSYRLKFSTGKSADTSRAFRSSKRHQIMYCLESLKYKLPAFSRLPYLTHPVWKMLYKYFKIVRVAQCAKSFSRIFLPPPNESFEWDICMIQISGL